MKLERIDSIDKLSNIEVMVHPGWFSEHRIIDLKEDECLMVEKRVSHVKATVSNETLFVLLRAGLSQNHRMARVLAMMEAVKAKADFSICSNHPIFDFSRSPYGYENTADLSNKSYLLLKHLFEYWKDISSDGELVSEIMKFNLSKSFLWR